MCARGPFLAIVVLAGLAACDAAPRSTSPEVVLDLAALLPFTDDAAPTTEIRPGDPAQRMHLLRGWSAPMRLDDGTSGARIVNGWMGTVVFHAGHKPHPISVRVERRLLGDAPPPRYDGGLGVRQSGKGREAGAAGGAAAGGVGALAGSAGGCFFGTFARVIDRSRFARASALERQTATANSVRPVINAMRGRS